MLSVGIIQSVTCFVAQLTLSGIYNYDGMRMVSLIMLLLWVIQILIIINLNRMMKQKKLNMELKYINQNRKETPRYT